MTVQIHFLSISYFSYSCWEQSCWKSNLFRCIFFPIRFLHGMSTVLSKRDWGLEAINWALPRELCILLWCKISQLSLAIHFTHDSVYKFMLLSPFVPSSPSATISMSPFSTSLSPFSSVQFSSVAQSCPTLCDPLDYSTPGLPVHHQLLEFTQTHVHWVGDAIQASHPLSSPSPPAPNTTQHQSLF